MSGAKVFVGDMDNYSGYAGIVRQDETKPHETCQTVLSKISKQKMPEDRAKTVLKEIKLGWILST